MGCSMLCNSIVGEGLQLSAPKFRHSAIATEQIDEHAYDTELRQTFTSFVECSYNTQQPISMLLPLSVQVAS